MLRGRRFGSRLTCASSSHLFLMGTPRSIFPFSLKQPNTQLLWLFCCSFKRQNCEVNKKDITIDIISLQFSILSCQTRLRNSYNTIKLNRCLLNHLGFIQDSRYVKEHKIKRVLYTALISYDLPLSTKLSFPLS